MTARCAAKNVQWTFLGQEPRQTCLGEQYLGERRINSFEQELLNYPDAQQKMSRGHF
jgi:hypothetical protein